MRKTTFQGQTLRSSLRESTSAQWGTRVWARHPLAAWGPSLLGPRVRAELCTTLLKDPLLLDAELSRHLISSN